MPGTTQPLKTSRQWYHTATVYQIYPASFKDSNADGWGDIQGIISKVDYIASLGVDAVWLSPCYTSPFVDNGYDISNYREIDPRFGTVADIEQLIAKLRTHNIKLLMDLVVNHTSDQHLWFRESSSSLTSPKRDWYIWRKGRQAQQADGSAWQFDKTTGEFYLHLFCTEQPDLNWSNPQVRKAVHDDMRFWLDRGIGGFRMDVINLLNKQKDFPDVPIVNPKSPFQPASHLYANGPNMHQYLREIRQVLDDYSGVMTVGEMPFTHDPEIVRSYVAPDRHELNMVFQFDLFHVDIGPPGRFTPYQWQLSTFKAAIVKWQQALCFSSGAWATTFLESHDVARSVSRFGDGTAENRVKVAKMLAMLETTLGGTLFMHQGQEIGMTNLTKDIPIEQYPDIETKNFLRDMMELRNVNAHDGQQVTLSDIIQEFGDEVRLKARDHGRMPMPWDASLPHAGFSDATGNVKPWTVLNGDSHVCNVARQERESDSVLNFWRHMLKFRSQHVDTIVFGDFVADPVDNEPVFAYTRTPSVEDGQKGAKSMLVVLNLSNQPTRYQLPHQRRFSALESTTGRTYDTDLREGVLQLGVYEAVTLAY